MKNFKRILAVALCAVMMLSVTACSDKGDANTNKDGAKDTNADKGLPIIGDSVKFDPNKLVNNGEPIEIEFWEWGSTPLFEKITTAYTEMYPNVSIKLVENPWADYWTKLPLALKSDSGPAIFNIHNSYHDNIIGNLTPYTIETAELEADFTGVPAHVIDDKIYYIDYGIMTGSIYYNTDMWTAAGLTDADIPKTWEQFREVAKKLTIKSGTEFTQAGFNFNDSFRNFLIGLNYQWDENMFNADGTSNFNNPKTVEITQMFYDMYEVDQVGSPNFGNSSNESFGQGLSAMVPAWGNFKNDLANNYPDIKYSVFEIPTPTTEVPYAYNRYNGESTFGVNNKASAGAQEVAQDLIRFFLANDSLQTEFNLAMATFPAKISLADSPEILANPTMSVLADTIDRYIWPGSVPATVENNSKIAVENIFNNGMDIEEALQQAEDTINEELKTTNFVAVENLYKYAK